MAENTEKYFYALGRRKTSTATVRLFETEGKSKINGKDFSSIYKSDVYAIKVSEPFKVLELDPNKFMFTAKTAGGGVVSQLEAIVLGLSRALVKMNESYKKALKDADLLTRDSRMVERKKPGLRKARRAEQYSKR
jgi:small subunit ribosomal protein S9